MPDEMFDEAVQALKDGQRQRAKDLLTDLSGSVANISEAFSLRPDPKNIKWLDYSQYYQKYRDFHQNELAWFFKDDWKLRPDLTFNLGVRWEWYGVPYEGNGLMAAPIGGSDGLFGLSGRGFADWYKPGVRGELTKVEFVGKHSPQPGLQRIAAGLAYEFAVSARPVSAQHHSRG